MVGEAAAVGLLQLPRHRAWVEHFDPATVALLRHLIVTGAWWDHVDAIAGRPVGDGLRARPDAWTPVLREWAHDPDLWLRRAAIICQLLSREATDLELLTEAIEASAPVSNRTRSAGPRSQSPGGAAISSLSVVPIIAGASTLLLSV